MTYEEYLLRKARAEFKRSGVLSLSTVMALAGAGYDVAAIEAQIANDLSEEESDS